MDLDITSVPKTNSGKSELEVNTANLSGSWLEAAYGWLLFLRKTFAYSHTFSFT
jgi:hypothetical protein